MRIAVLADIHGNLPALRAVLTEVDRERVDMLMVAGDVVAGPLPRESLELLAARPGPVHWIRGNSEREAVSVYDGAQPSDDPAGRAAKWSADALDQRWRDELASWPITAVLDGVRFCHGSPRRDDEILTVQTPEAAFSDALSATSERLVIGGHTHRQFIREVCRGVTYANAGSVGLPYEGRPGAFWLMVVDGGPVMRETSYDLDAAVAELRAAGLSFDEQLERSLLDPADPDWVSALLERSARGG